MMEKDNTLSIKALAASYGISRNALYALMEAAGLGGCRAWARRRLTGEQCAAIRAGIGRYWHTSEYRYTRRNGGSSSRPIVHHADIVRYFEIGRSTCWRWMREEGLGHLMPHSLGRNCLLPAEVNLVIWKLKDGARRCQHGRLARDWWILGRRW